MTRIGSRHTLVTDENGKTRLVSKTGKARWAHLPVNKQKAAAHNEKHKVKPGSRRKADSLPANEKSKS